MDFNQDLSFLWLFDWDILDRPRSAGLFDDNGFA